MTRINSLRLVYTGKGEASFNMALDSVIARSVIEDSAVPALRFYTWDRPSLSIGYFQNLKGFNLDFIIKKDIPLVRRPTGGRAILHDRELTYSFSTRLEGVFKDKSIFESYKIISSCLVKAFRMMGIPAQMSERKRGNNIMRNPLCFKSLSFGEITLDGKKIVGSAQKRYKGGFLQQGSIPFSINSMVRDVFMVDNLEGMGGLGEFIDLDDNILVDRLIEYISRAFMEEMGVKIVMDMVSPEEIKSAMELRDSFIVKTN